MCRTKLKTQCEDVSAGQKLRDLRLRKSISQEALGKVLGITFQQIQKYEKGTNRMSVSTVSKLSKALQVPPSYFFDTRQENFTPVQSKRELELLRLSKQLTSEQQDALCRIARTIIDNTPNNNQAQLLRAKEAA